MKPMLEVSDLCKTYIVNKHQNHVLRNISFQIMEGEMVAIMGPSGSGKSTLLYAVSGMDRITAGSVLFHGHLIHEMKEQPLADLRLEEMGFVFQQMYMLKNLTVGDNILLPAMQSKRNKAGKKDKIRHGEALMKRLGIQEIAEHDITEVSGGQLQRACICRSMMNHPSMIFADEPTGALNRSASDEVMDELAQINRDGTTILLVTHDVKVAAKCSRILFLVDGVIKGEYELGNYEEAQTLRDRERTLNHWLLEMGW